jgi:hypothetical protein
MTNYLGARTYRIGLLVLALTASCARRAEATENAQNTNLDDYPKIGEGVLIGTLRDGAGNALNGYLVQGLSKFPRPAGDAVTGARGEFDLRVQRFVHPEMGASNVLPETVLVEIAAMNGTAVIARETVATIIDSLSRTAPKTSVTLIAR